MRMPLYAMFICFFFSFIRILTCAAIAHMLYTIDPLHSKSSGSLKKI